MLNMEKSSIINHQSSIKRATALLLVVVLLALLAIMGTTFVISTRIEKVAADNQQKGFQTDQAMDSVLAIIQNTLSEDLWDVPEDALDTTGAVHNRLRLLGVPAKPPNGASDDPSSITLHNEPWDAPTTGGNAVYYYFDGTDWQTATINVDGDPWLASMEAVYHDNGTSGDTSDDWWEWNRASDVLFTGENSYFSGIKDHINDTLDNTEKYADADGDGVLDSSWIVQKGIFPDSDSDGYVDVDGDGNEDALEGNIPVNAPAGTAYRLAVRIIDTCGMVNVNTAWAIPSEYTATPGDFLGNTFAGVNLYGAANFGYASDLPGRPSGSDLATMLNYQNEYIFKIESPDWANLNTNFSGFYPLDLSDELELRYKWADNTGLTTEFESKFTNLTNANRHFLTAYSFSRNIRRESWVTSGTDARFPAVYNLQETIKDLIGRVNSPAYTLNANQQQRLKLFVQCIYNSFLADTAIGNYADGSSLPNGGTNFTDAASAANYHTWQYIANLVDYLDDDDVPIDIQADGSLATDLGLSNVGTGVTFNGDTHVYGLERHFAVTEVVLTCTQAYVDASTPAKYQIDVELHNPWAENLTRNQKCEVYWNGALHETKSGNYTINTNLFSPKISFVTKTSVNSDPTTYTGTLTVVLKTNSGIPEDVFHIDINSGNLSNTVNDIMSWQRDTSNAWKSLSNDYGGPYSSDTLGVPNTGYSSPATPCGYATSTTTIADTWRDPSQTSDDTLWDKVNVGGTDYYFARLKNFSDIAAVPYVGYIIDTTGVQKGIGDWLSFNDDKVHFDFTEEGIYKTPTPDKKAGVLRDRLCEAFKLLDRADDGIDQNGDGIIDDRDEMRLPGLINVNTAPATVLEALQSYVVGHGSTIVGNRPYKTIGQVVQYVPVGGGEDFFIRGLNGAYDVVEKSTKWTRFANLITNRSDTFAAYILLEALDANGNTVSRRREIVLFDRSMCNQPPLIWDATNSVWIVNPNYRKPAIVARQRVD